MQSVRVFLGDVPFSFFSICIPPVGEDGYMVKKILVQL
jgi:hypothetical protein